MVKFQSHRDSDNWFNVFTIDKGSKIGTDTINNCDLMVVW